MKTVIITGSCGLVGSESATFFSKKGFRIIGIDNNSRKSFFGKDGDISQIRKKLQKEIKNYVHYNLDIRNYNLLKKIFLKYIKNIKLIIHCAAQPSHDWAKSNPIIDFNINSIGTLNMLENFRKYVPNAKFILTSTNKVYGDTPNNLPLEEKKT